MKPAVLVLANLYDLATDLVCLRLKELATPFVRLNRDQLSDFHLTLDPFGPTLLISHGSLAWEITSDIRSIWYRQPVFLRDALPEPATLDAQLERSQWMAFIKGLTVFEAARWVNHPRETYQAEAKPYQLAMAKRVGFRVARTLIGNDAAQFDTFPRPIVIKPLDTVFLHDGTDSLFAYAATVDAIGAQQAFERAPVIAQCLIDPKTDIRVTVIGSDAYAVRILYNGKPIEGDWRKTPKDQLQYDDWPIPSEIRARCIELTTALGLSFGGIDLIENEGEVYFIEINPTGEWAWLNSADRPMDRTIAHLLSAD